MLKTNKGLSGILSMIKDCSSTLLHEKKINNKIASLFKSLNTKIKNQILIFNCFSIRLKLFLWCLVIP